VRETRVWDIPVRVFHLLLVAGFIAAFALAETRDDDDPTFILHMGLGLVVGLMACLRVLWGLFGTEHARFTGFALAPVALFRYLRGLFWRPGPAYLGHNPASSYATLIMLGLLLGLAISGILLARGNEGAEEFHEVCATGMLVVSVIHVAGVVWHAIRYRDGIALGIIDGKKAGDPDSISVPRCRAAALVFVAIVVGCAGLLLGGYDSSAGKIRVPGIGWTISGEEDHHDDDDHHEKRKHHKKRKHRDRRHHDDD